MEENIPALGLLRGDREEPSEDRPDIAALEYMAEFPVTVLFWRPSSETLARHKNPLSGEALGFTPQRAVCCGLAPHIVLGGVPDLVHCGCL